MAKGRKPAVPTVEESLAQISESLRKIAEELEFGLYNGKGDCVLETIKDALHDIAEYGPGRAPKGHYRWRHQSGDNDDKGKSS